MSLEEGDEKKNLWIVFPYFSAHDVADLESSEVILKKIKLTVEKSIDMEEVPVIGKNM